MGRSPEGAEPMTGAARQARYRARQTGGPEPAGSRSAKLRPPPRPQRWDAAVGTLIALREEYVAWYEALPEATRDGPTGEMLLAIVELDLEELSAIRPPRGFGRD